MHDQRATVRLLDPHDVQKCRRGEGTTTTGALPSLAYFVRVLSTNRWHLAIDLGGYVGSVRASVSVVWEGRCPGCQQR